MKVNPPTERQIIEQALKILFTRMTSSSVARFVAFCQLGDGDYLKTKEWLFAGETVDSLYKKIQDFENSKNESIF